MQNQSKHELNLLVVKLGKNTSHTEPYDQDMLSLEFSNILK